MTFEQAYANIKPSIVAVVAKVSRNKEFPDILGTGFIVRGEGLIATNRHVIKAIKSLPKLKGAPGDEWPVDVIIFHNVAGLGLAELRAPVKACFGFSLSTKPLYGPQNPDIGLLRIGYSNLPAVEIETDPNYLEGEEVGAAGFPMGVDLLQAPGYLHQINPTLRKGVISAILPFPCPDPHALMIDMMVQGGSSGSPVFSPKTGKVIGVVYGGLQESNVVKSSQGERLLLKLPTGITYAVPSHLLAKSLIGVDKNAEWRKHDIGEILDFEEAMSDAKKKYEAGELQQSEPKMVESSQVEFRTRLD